MRLALLGDVHGNDLALRAVLAAASESRATRLLVTGDLVGYYYRALNVLDLLRPWDKDVVRGNHEEMLQVARSDPSYLASVDARYGTGLRAALAELNEQDVEMLCTLPHPLRLDIDGCRILLCHGSPGDLDRYVYPDANEELLASCAREEEDIVVLGHTHYPMRREVGRTLVVNPGSVGQPRNRQPGAHWAMFDTETREISLRCEAYDISALVAESRRRDPEIAYLAEVLVRT